MFTFIKESFNEGAVGIDVSCKNCGHMNFVRTKATAAPEERRILIFFLRSDILKTSISPERRCYVWA